MEAGWSHFKIKVGEDLKDDVRRSALIRAEIGPDRKLMMDANQRWDVDDAIASMQELARFDPWWIEEPTSPDDILGHAAIAKAIAAFERTVLSGDSAYDKFEAGDESALTDAQKRGMELFENVGCDSCHKPPLFSNYRYYNAGIGMDKETPDPGRKNNPEKTRRCILLVAASGLLNGCHTGLFL